MKIDSLADTRLDVLFSTDDEAARSLRDAIQSRSGFIISINEVRSCNTVRELAQHLADLGGRKRLSPPYERAEKEDGGREYPVWFGTNRCPVKSADGKLEFSATRDTQTHLGTCSVFVPKSHHIGSLGSSWLKRTWTGVDDRLQLVDVKELAAASYWSAMNDALQAVDIDDRDVVAFIHGYNVSFADAALRAAQIGFDLSIRGAMAFFSWPSQGSLSAYLADEATIEASEAAISQFMADIATYSKARAVHIIAHSMGNRGVLRAVSRIATNAEERSRVRFDQIILAAPDVDADVFRQLCSAYTAIASRTTLYISAKDRAVEASRWLHQYPRVGLMPPVCVVAGIDTVNVANADLTTLGHGYVAETKDVLRDMHDLISHGTPPDRRFGLRAAVTDAGEPFWIVGA